MAITRARIRGSLASWPASNRRSIEAHARGGVHARSILRGNTRSGGWGALVVGGEREGVRMTSAAPEVRERLCNLDPYARTF